MTKDASEQVADLRHKADDYSQMLEKPRFRPSRDMMEDLRNAVRRSADTIEALTAERDALQDGLEAACDVQNWIENNAPDDLFERVPTEPWNRITNAVMIARANSPTTHQETAV